VRTPATVAGPHIDHEVVPHRSSSKPVARRMADSVPLGTVSESLPAGGPLTRRRRGAPCERGAGEDRLAWGRSAKDRCHKPRLAVKKAR
jgi:hypothetical protein